MKYHQTLKGAMIARSKEWTTPKDIPLSFYGNELAGEAGEACNIIKKLERERLGMRTSYASKRELADELADVMICVHLIANHQGIDIDRAVKEKFNQTSERYGFETRLA